MIKAHNVVILVSWALLSAAPWIYAQDVKPTEARLMLQRPPVIQELALEPKRFLSLSLGADPASAPSVEAPDLSRYREFQLGMNLRVVAKQADLEPSEARVIHQRPAVIQELEWRPPRSLGSSPQADPVSQVLFSFYNGELFRMVVNYDRYKTEGLTDEDMVEAISAKYGTATKPAAEIILFSSFQVYNDSEKVIARWDDSRHSFNLFRSSYQPTFGMLVFSKRLDALARAAVVEAIRLDEQEKARLVNKPNFRP